MTNAALNRFKDLKAKGIVLGPAPYIPEWQIDQAIRARAQRYWAERGISTIHAFPEPHNTSEEIAKSILISRAHWPHLKNTPERLMQGIVVE